MSFPYSGDDPYLYASYAREDRKEVQSEMEHLHHLGYRVSFSNDEVDEDLLRGAGYAVFFISPCTNDSDEMRSELQLASQAGLDTLAIHLDEVELDGTVGLLLGGIDDVKKYRMKEAFYRRQLETSIDDSLKREGVTPPPIRDEPVAAVSPPKGRSKSKSSGPGLVESFKAMDRNQKIAYGGVGGAFLFVVFALIGMVATSPDDVVVPVTDGSATGEAPVNELTKEEREKQAKALKAELEQRRVEREKAREERETKDRAGAAFTAALSKLRAGDAKGSLADFDTAISLLPDNAEFHMARGRARFKARDDAGAVADFTKVIALQPENIIAYMERAETQKYSNYDAAIADYTKVLELQKGHVDALIGRGDAKRKKKDYKAAIKDYTLSLKTKKKYGAYYGRSLCYKKLGDKKRYNRDQELARELRQ